MLIHPIPPVFDSHSSVLVLGSFPSVKSREVGFYYGHPQNRFWRVLSAVFEDEVPVSVDEKRAFLLRHGVALWDIIQSCEIDGSSDNSIRSVTPNDLSVIISTAPIHAIFVNGRTAEKYYRQYAEPIVKRHAICLPSTSPANAAYSRTRLTEEWKKIKSFTGIAK